MVVFGSVWSDLLVLHNYCVIISECQKVTLMEVKAKTNVKKWKKTKLLEMARKLIENVLGFFDQYGRVAAAH